MVPGSFTCGAESREVPGEVPGVIHLCELLSVVECWESVVECVGWSPPSLKSQKSQKWLPNAMNAT